MAPSPFGPCISVVVSVGGQEWRRAAWECRDLVCMFCRSSSCKEFAFFNNALITCPLCCFPGLFSVFSHGSGEGRELPFSRALSWVQNVTCNETCQVKGLSWVCLPLILPPSHPFSQSPFQSTLWSHRKATAFSFCRELIDIPITMAVAASTECSHGKLLFKAHPPSPQGS